MSRTRHLRDGTCRSCRGDIVVIRHDGLEVALDADPLNPLGETAALLAGLRTFHRCAPHVLRRSAPLIHMEPRPLSGTIHRTHPCGIPVAPVFVAEVSKIYDGDEPPF